METIFIRLKALLPEILEAQQKFDSGYDAAADGCRGSNARSLARHYAGFNVVLKRAFEAVAEDTKGVNNRSTLEMSFAPKGDFSLWFHPRGEQAYRFLSDVVRTSSFNVNYHASRPESADAPEPDAPGL